MYLIKLFNGEDIVCNIKPTTSKEHTTIQNPMKMNTHPAITDTGIMETLSLSSWLHPYTEESNIKIKKSAIITVAPASPGLITFYNRQLKRFLKERPELARREWEVREREHRPNINAPRSEHYDELLDQLMELGDYPPNKKKLH